MQTESVEVNGKNTIVKVSNGQQYNFEPVASGNYELCVLERHNMTVYIQRHTRMNSVKYSVLYKTKMQKSLKTHCSNQDFTYAITAIEKIFNSQHKRECQKAEDKIKDKIENQKFLADLKQGSILCSTWGYSMTIVDFYKVVKVKGSKVTLIELQNKYPDNDNGSISGSKVVASDVEVGEPKEYTVRSTCITINSSSRARLWDGKPMYENRND